MTNTPQIGDQTGLGKAAESAELVTKELRTLLYDFLNPVAKEAGESLATYFRYFRAENVISVFRKAKKLRKQKKLNNKPTPPRILAPLVEKASVEDDDYLQDLWASLLATSNDEYFRPYFISILSELSPLEAKICQYIYAHGEIKQQIMSLYDNSVQFVSLKEVKNIKQQGGSSLFGDDMPHFMGFVGCSCLTDEIHKKFAGSLDIKDMYHHDDVFEAIEDLERLRMVQRFSSSSKEYRVQITMLAANLLRKLAIGKA